MKCIKEECTFEIIINKSRFIGIACPIYNVLEVNEKINFYKKKYKDATHYCYAYIIDGNIKSSDDGEPSGTAGIPILNILKNNNLNYILLIVIRYFGGIKLGSGGLIRAYSNCSSEVLKEASICSLVNGYYIELEFDYEDTKVNDNYLKDINIEKKYNEKVIYTFKITSLDFDKIEKLIKGKILKKEPILMTV